jgi:hypothetical protein
MAGDEGFEPPIMGPEPTALPLGQSPLLLVTEVDCTGYTLKTQVSKQK